jgi:ferric iron reductase protein FhuF
MTGVEWVHAATAPDAATIMTESLIEQVLRPLNTTLRAATALSFHVMWGNVASAANGAVTVLSQSRPADRDRGRALVRALIGIGPLLGTAELPDGKFRRRNCCLFYLTGSEYCGDCVLTARRATPMQRAPD